MKFGKCCGAVIYSRQNGNLKYLVIKHRASGGGHWHFPKGHVENKETEHQTATREIFEETGLKVNFLDGFRKVEEYYDKINDEQKKVVFFLSKAIDNNVRIDNDEIVDYKWLGFESALDQLTHDQTKKLLNLANEFLKNNNK
jgi:bis(5'-nucleosidyl)-tetraphosphatase